VTHVIAVAGKGGSGKTTLAALLVRALLERGRKPVLAVDADPNTNLGEALGVRVATTLGQTVEELHGDMDAVPAGMSKGTVMEMRFASILEERAGFDVLSMGRGEGPGCYCSINNMLRAMVENLSKNYAFVVIDNEAGLEHLSRRTQRRIDVMLEVSDFAVRGLRAATRIDALVDELKLDVRHRMLVVSRAPADDEAARGALGRMLERAGLAGPELAGIVPVDPALVEADLDQRGLLDIDADAPAIAAARAILNKVLEKISAMV
jgi:CO dehydrogenase maturation factor